MKRVLAGLILALGYIQAITVKECGLVLEGIMIGAVKAEFPDLDACFDDAAFLRHVHPIIDRLERLEPTVASAGVRDADR